MTVLATLALTDAAATGARAQPTESVAVNQYRAAPLSSDGFVVAGSEVPPHLVPDAQLHLEYSNDPLVFEGAPGTADSEGSALVSDQLSAHLVAAVGLFDRVAVYGGMPFHLVLQGEQVGPQPSATGAGTGDLSLGARVRVTDAGAPFSMAVGLAATASTGRQPSQHAGVAGESGATVLPRLVLQWSTGSLQLRGNVGMRLRRDKEILGVRYTDHLVYAVGAEWGAIRDRLAFQLEIFGATPSDDIGNPRHTPLEVLAGSRLWLPFGLSLGAGGGLGVLRGLGAPDVRFALRVGFRPEQATAPSAQDDEASRLRDASETADAMTEQRSPRSPERAAPRPEPVAPAPGNPYAPPPAEPMAPPDPAPVTTAADNAYQDTDGDGTLDLDDTCPALPGAARRGGCPDTLRLDAQTGAVTLLRSIDFHRRRATLRTRSRRVLRDLQSLLAARPEVHVRLLVHISPRSRVNDQGALGRARAQTLRSWGDGLPAASRVEILNCGSRRPPATRDRSGLDGRVEAFVITPLPPAGMPSSLHCTPVPAVRP